MWKSRLRPCLYGRKSARQAGWKWQISLPDRASLVHINSPVLNNVLGVWQLHKSLPVYCWQVEGKAIHTRGFPALPQHPNMVPIVCSTFVSGSSAVRFVVVGCSPPVWRVPPHVASYDTPELSSSPVLSCRLDTPKGIEVSLSKLMQDFFTSLSR